MTPIIEHIYAEIERLQNEVLRQQGLCSHRNLKRTPRSDTGNWCKSDDCYWYEFHCQDCDKFWTEEQ